MTHRPRRQKLIKSALQLRMVAAFLFLGCIAALFQVTLLNLSLTELSESMQADRHILVQELPDLFVSNIGLTLAVLVPLTLLVGILVTHRVAGPAHRIELYLEALARGEDPGRCTIRKGDELQELCEKLNAAVETLKQQAEQPEVFESRGSSRAA